MCYHRQMAIEVLLRKRQTRESAFGILLALAVAANFRGPTCALWASLCAQRIFSYGLVWSSLKSSHLLTELRMTNTDTRKMVDQVALHTLKRVTAMSTVPLVFLIAEQGGTLTLGAFVAVVLSLSYLVQAWALLTDLRPHWTYICVPPALIFLSFPGVVVFLEAAQCLFSPLVPALLTLLFCWIWIPRLAARLCVDRRDPFSDEPIVGAKVTRSPRTAATFPNGNPVVSRSIRQWRDTRWLLLGGSISASILIIQTDAVLSLDLLAGLSALAGIRAYSLSSHERRTGTLELLKISRLSSSEIVCGWLVSACLPSLLILTLFAPTIVYQSLPGATLTILAGMAAFILSALLGIAAGVRNPCE